MFFLLYRKYMELVVDKSVSWQITNSILLWKRRYKNAFELLS